MSGNTLHWVYARIFDDEARQGKDDIVCDVAGPLFRTIRDDGYAQRGFFLRYSEGGHHLRIRFLTNQQEAVRAMIVAQAKRYFEPSGIAVVEQAPPTYKAQSEYDLTAWRNCRAPGVIEFDTYEPEYHKYGGINGMPISENIFDASSRLVVAALDFVHRGVVSRERVALYIMDELLRIFDVPPEERADWFASYYAYWRRATGLKQDIVAAEFESRYTNLKKVVALTLERIPQHEEEWLKELQHHHLKWKLAMLDDAALLKRLYDTNALADQHPALIVFNLIHVHNNRFGVSMAHESYLAYMLSRYYAEHIGQQPAITSTHDGYLNYILRRHFETQDAIAAHPNDLSHVPT